MHTFALSFIQDLAIIMLVTAGVTILCYYVKQPVVLGYIITGIIIGPFTPPFALISNPNTIKILAELGVIFLMFSLGLEFNLHKLKKFSVSAFIAATLEIILMMWLGYKIGMFFGWTEINAIFLGALLAISSTTIIIKTLDEMKLKHKQSSQLIFGILIIEDIFAILILTFLSSIAISGSLQASNIVVTSIKLTSFLVVSLILGILFIPKMLANIAKIKSNEILLISVLGLCFGFCLLVAKLGYSMALGAFIMGAIIAESQPLVKIEGLVNPLRDMFSAIFFVSVGLLFNPDILGDYYVPIILITAAVIVGKIFSCSLGILIAGYNPRTALQVGMGLAQIGEFSFIIASLGVTLKVTDNYLYSIAVCVSIITTLTTPYLIKYSDTCANLIKKVIPKHMTNYSRSYVAWIQELRSHEDELHLTNAVRRSIIQIIINLFVIIAIFLIATYIAKTNLGYMLVHVTNNYLQKSIIWTTALIFALPSLIACYRKIQALSMMLAEISIKGSFDKKFTIKIRRFVAQSIVLIATFGIAVLVFILSVKILPPIEMVLAIVAIIAIILVFTLPWLIKLHSMVQINLMEVLNNNQDKD